MVTKPTAKELTDQILRAGGGVAGSLDMKAYSLSARVERVLRLHREQKWQGRGICNHCQNDVGSSVSYPCETVRILDGVE